MTNRIVDSSPFGIKATERVVLMIDGFSVYGHQRFLGFDVDFGILLKHFKDNCDLRRVFYYTVMVETEAHNPIRRLTDWLSFNGYNVVIKEGREVIDEETAHRRVLGKVDSEMSVDLPDCAEYADHIVLFSGNGELTYAVSRAKRNGTKISVVSVRDTSGLNCDTKLRRAADSFIDLRSIRSLVENPRRSAAGSNTGEQPSADEEAGIGNSVPRYAGAFTPPASVR